MRLTLISVMLLLAINISAQSLSGTVVDSKNMPVVSAQVTLYKDNVFEKKTLTDAKGHYSIKALDSGTYNLIFSCRDHDSISKTDVQVYVTASTVLNVMLPPKHYQLKEVVVAYKPPSILCTYPASNNGVLKERDIRNVCGGLGSPSELVATAPGVYQSQRVSTKFSRLPGIIFPLDPVPVSSAKPALVCTCGEYQVKGEHLLYDRTVDNVAWLSGGYQQQLGADVHF